MRWWALGFGVLVLATVALFVGGRDGRESTAVEIPTFTPSDQQPTMVEGAEPAPDEAQASDRPPPDLSELSAAFEAELLRVSAVLADSNDAVDLMLSSIFRRAATQAGHPPTPDQLQRIAGMQPRGEAVLMWLIDQCSLHAPDSCPIGALTKELRQLAPDNAVAWLLPEPAPGAPLDREQLAQAASASRYNAIDSLLLPALDRALLNFAALDGVERSLAVIGIAAAMPGPVWWAQQCVAALDRAAMLAACEHLAQQVYATAPSLLDQLIAAGLARRLAQSDSVEALQWQAAYDELMALLERFAQSRCAFDDPKVANEFLQNRINAGERYAIESLLELEPEC